MFLCYFPSINIFHITCVFVSVEMKIDNIEDKINFVAYTDGGRGWMESKEKNQFLYVKEDEKQIFRHCEVFIASLFLHP